MSTEPPLPLPAKIFPMHEDGELCMWVVYDHPTDCPEKWVARRWVGRRATNAVLLADTLDALRKDIWRRTPGVSAITRFPGDDPKIVEVWL